MCVWCVYGVICLCAHGHKDNRLPPSPAVHGTNHGPNGNASAGEHLLAGAILVGGYGRDELGSPGLDEPIP